MHYQNKRTKEKNANYNYRCNLQLLLELTMCDQGLWGLIFCSSTTTARSALRKAPPCVRGVRGVRGVDQQGNEGEAQQDGEQGQPRQRRHKRKHHTSFTKLRPQIGKHVSKQFSRHLSKQHTKDQRTKDDKSAKERAASRMAFLKRECARRCRSPHDGEPDVAGALGAPRIGVEICRPVL